MKSREELISKSKLMPQNEEEWGFGARNSNAIATSKKSSNDNDGL